MSKSTQAYCYHQKTEGYDSLRIFAGNKYIGTIGGSDETTKEQLVNADLVVEAFNVAEVTGLTPRQLAHRCAALETALVAVLRTHENTRFNDSACALAAGKSVAEAYTAIANAPGEPA